MDRNVLVFSLEEEGQKQQAIEGEKSSLVPSVGEWQGLMNVFSRISVHLCQPKACMIVSLNTTGDKVACSVTFLCEVFTYESQLSPYDLKPPKIRIVFTWPHDTYSNSYHFDLLILKS